MRGGYNLGPPQREAYEGVELTPMIGTLGYIAAGAMSHLVRMGDALRVMSRTDVPKLDIFAAGVVLYAMLFRQ